MLAEGSATGAAKVLGVSQPTISATLAKLRVTLGDELFVRTTQGLEPTSRALDLGVPIRKILDILDEEVLGAIQFQPETSRRAFTLSVGELGHMQLVRRFLPGLMAAAPNIQIHLRTTTPDHRREDLVKGHADLAIGHFPYFDGFDIFQQSLQASHRFVGIARSGHPILQGEGPTLARFQALEHAVVGQDYPPIYDTVLKELGVKRQIKAVLSIMAGAHTLIETSNLVAIVPEALARMYAEQASVASFSLPFELPPLEVKMFWHRRSAHDPGIQWLRSMVAKDFGATMLPESSA